MRVGPTSDRRLDAAVGASLAWYEAVFDVHRIPTRCEGGLWRALGEPPRWHSAAKTVQPDVPAAAVVSAMEPFESGSVADSYANLDLDGHGFRQLFRATWLFRAAPAGPGPSWPDGWTVVSDDDELSAWNTAQDTTGVLVPALLHHPRFTFLVRYAAEQMVAGAVLHRVDDVVDLSNTWSLDDEADQIPSMLRCAEAMYPQLPVVGYSRNDLLSPYLDAGFSAVGPKVVWVRGN